MSHVSKCSVKSFDNVRPEVLREAIKIAAKLLNFNGVKITDYVLDWDGCHQRSLEGIEIICALDAFSSASSGEFPGMGLGVDKHGKLVIIGDFYHQRQQDYRDKLRKKLEKVLGSACSMIACKIAAQRKGMSVVIKVDSKNKRLNLVAAK
ncbi:hypothetical protein ACFL08_05445 [Patescibacteria group bacterium]